MAGKWAHLHNPIREAAVARMRPSDVLRAIRAGTLPGVERPTAISDRSFYERWKRAKRDLGPDAHQESEGSLGPLGLTAKEFARRVDEIAEEEATAQRLVEKWLADGRGPAEILEEIVDSMEHLSPDHANELLPSERRLDPESWELRRLYFFPSPRPLGRDQIQRGDKLIDAGASLEQVARATYMSIEDAEIIFSTALAKRG